MKQAIRRPAAAILAVGILAAWPAAAAEVRIEHKGAGLLGEAALAPGKSWKDGAILMVHGTMTHRSFSTLAHQQKALLEQEFSSLSITLSLNVPDRRGNADCEKPQTHRQQDAVAEIAAWVAYLKSQGAANITLFGHSRGANQILRYAIAGADPAVKRVVFLGPASWSDAMSFAGYGDAPAGELDKNLAEAKKMAAAGRGNELMKDIRMLNCPKTSASATAFLSYYTDDGEMRTLDLLDKIRVPILVVEGSADTITPNVAKQLQAKNYPHVKVGSINGADHFFRDLIADEVADLVAPFIKGN